MDDGDRTHDNKNHNLALYQLSYAHHNLARPAGFEPATLGLEGRCSIQMSYGRLGYLSSVLRSYRFPFPCCGVVRAPKRWTVEPHAYPYTLSRFGSVDPRIILYVTKRHPDPWLSTLPFTIIHEPMLVKNWSGWRDSNSRPTAPKAVALPGCATPRLLPHSKARNNTPIKNVRQLNNGD